MLLLPSSLMELASNMCPELGTKGYMPHKDITVDMLSSMEKEIKEYFSQDVRLLAAIMLKGKDIFWNMCQIDFLNLLTLSSLALTIFRMEHYDVQRVKIHIPNEGEDQFIRRAYFGGRTDVFQPYGEDLYYYDVNSLYPYIMKEYPMPASKPEWMDNLQDTPIENLLWFHPSLC